MREKVELSVGQYPHSKKICLVLTWGGRCKILARFDSPELAKEFSDLHVYCDSDREVKHSDH